MINFLKSFFKETKYKLNSNVEIRECVQYGCDAYQYEKCSDGRCRYHCNLYCKCQNNKNNIESAYNYSETVTLEKSYKPRRKKYKNWGGY